MRSLSFKAETLLVTIFVLNLVFMSNVANALENGNYTGAYKTTYVAAENKDSKVGDTGVFEFVVEDNKIIKIHDYDDNNWNRAKTKYYFTINNDTGEVDGHAVQQRSFNNPPITLMLLLKGKFIGKKFAGEADIRITSPINIRAERLVFESMD